MRWWDPVRKRTARKSTGEQGFRAADRVRREQQLRLEDDGPQTPEGALSLSGLVESYVAHLKARTTRDHWSTVEHRVEAFRDHCPVRAAAAVRPEHVERFLLSLSCGRKTANHYRAGIRAMFRWAVRQRLVERNPVERVDPLPEDAREIVYLTEDEALTVMEAAAGTRYEIPIALALYAGLRRGEIVRLVWADVDLDEGILRIRDAKGPRGRQFRTVPVSDALRAILERERKRGTHHVASEGRKKWNPDHLTQGVKYLGRRAKVKRLTGPQVLRRTFGSILVSRGVPIFSVAKWLGHADVRITMRHYADLLPGHREGIDLIPVPAGLAPDRRGRIDEV